LEQLFHSALRVDVTLAFDAADAAQQMPFLAIAQRCDQIIRLARVVWPGSLVSRSGQFLICAAS
jgi:hypothetical protein